MCGDVLCLVYFFFQAEDGIRDLYVTGVQTCALPISAEPASGRHRSTERSERPCHDPDAGYRSASLGRHPADRKSTRLNSSHVEISYAVFCLKKKTNTPPPPPHSTPPSPLRHPRTPLP